MKSASLVLLIILGVNLAGCVNISHPPTQARVEPPAPTVVQHPPQARVEPPAPTVVQHPSQARVEPLPSPQSQGTFAQPNIRPGECWALAVINPKPLQKPKDIVVCDAFNHIEISPSLVDATEKEIIIREGGLTYRVEPPVYKRIREKVVVRPEIRRTIVVPPVFEERSVDIEVEAEHTVLEPCKVSTAHYTHGMPVQTLCSRRIPAKTKTIKRKILVQPETTSEVIEPAVYQEVSRWVIETPASIVPIDIPPQTKTLRVYEITRPELIEEKQVPQKIKRLMTTLYEGNPNIVFRRVVCDHELTDKLVKQVQQALKSSGFDPGSIDGKFGKHTYQAMLEYQRQNGLAYGALTYETLERLGVRAEQ